MSWLTTERICYLALLEFSIAYTFGAARLCLQLLFCLFVLTVEESQNKANVRLKTKPELYHHIAKARVRLSHQFEN